MTMTISCIDRMQLVADERRFGMHLQNALEEKRVTKLEAGTVMVAKFNESVSYLFELGFDIEVKTLKGASPMYPMQGSRLPMKRLPDGVTEKMILSKTVLFRDCRLPTALEYDKYLNAKTI